MCNKRIFFIYILIAFFAFSRFSFARSFVISEVMFNPNGNENAREYVELLNLSDEVMSLEGFLIGDGTGFDAIKPAAGESWTVPPGSFGLIVDPDYFTADEPYNIPAGTPLFTVDDKAIGNMGLSNSTAEPVYLISAHGDTVSMVYYSLDCSPGHSWERIIPSGSDSIDNFKPSKEEDGTPGQKNSVTPEPENPALDEESIHFSPSQPQMGDELKIILTYRNGGLEAVSDVTVNVWMLPDFQVGSAVFPETVAPGEISGEVSLSIDNVPGGSLAFTAAVVTDGITPSAEDDTITVTLDVSVPEATVILNEVMADPQNDEPEWIEIFNSAVIPIDLYHLNIADSKGTPVGRVSEHLFVPGNGYAVV